MPFHHQPRSQPFFDRLEAFDIDKRTNAGEVPKFLNILLCWNRNAGSEPKDPAKRVLFSFYGSHPCWGRPVLSYFNRLSPSLQ